MSHDPHAHPGRRILYCHCAFARVVPEEVKARVLEGLADADVAFDAVPDLCELAAHQDPSLERLAAAADGTELDIVACYPRAVKWLFHAANSPLPEEGVRIHNMRTTEAEAVLADVLTATTPQAQASEPTTAPNDSALETDP